MFQQLSSLLSRLFRFKPGYQNRIVPKLDNAVVNELSAAPACYFVSLAAGDGAEVFPDMPKKIPPRPFSPTARPRAKKPQCRRSGQFPYFAGPLQ